MGRLSDWKKILDLVYEGLLFKAELTEKRVDFPFLNVIYEAEKRAERQIEYRKGNEERSFAENEALRRIEEGYKRDFLEEKEEKARHFEEYVSAPGDAAYWVISERMQRERQSEPNEKEEILTSEVEGLGEVWQGEDGCTYKENKRDEIRVGRAKVERLLRVKMDTDEEKKVVERIHVVHKENDGEVFDFEKVTDMLSDRICEMMSRSADGLYL